MRTWPLIGLALLSGCNKIAPFMLKGTGQSSAGTASSLTVVEKGQSNMAFWGPNGGEAAFSQAVGRPVRFIRCGVPGTYIAQWQPGAEEQLACDAVDSGAIHVDVMLWYQGESDAQYGNPIYEQQMVNVFNYERKLHPGIRIVFAQLATTTWPGFSPYWNDIKAVQAAFHMPDVVMVKTEDLSLFDGLHLSPDSDRILGQRFARALLD